MISVTVRFSEGVSAETQAQALFALEQYLRDWTGDDYRVYKDVMADDSKLRRLMTPAERERL